MGLRGPSQADQAKGCRARDDARRLSSVLPRPADATENRGGTRVRGVKRGPEHPLDAHEEIVKREKSSLLSDRPRHSS
jgi:hypothetical protein